MKMFTCRVVGLFVAACGVQNFTSYAAIGSPDVHMIMNVFGVQESIGPCTPPKSTFCVYEPDCCAFVCSIDPFCCDTQWDCVCSDIASGCPKELDCNDNGIPDQIDIQLGLSEDCNDNCAPDECEYCPHGLATGAPRDGQIATGTLHDWTRELWTKRDRYDRDSDPFGRAEFYYRVTSAPLAGGGTYQILDRMENELWPEAASIHHRASKNKCNDNSCTEGPSDECRWEYISCRLMHDFVCSRDGNNFPPVELHISVVDKDNSGWGLFIGIFLFLSLAIVCLGAIATGDPFVAIVVCGFTAVMAGILLQVLNNPTPSDPEERIAQLHADTSGQTDHLPPLVSPNANGQNIIVCEHHELTDTIADSDARMELEWRVQQHGQAICGSSYGAAGGTVNDLAEFYVGHRSHNELFLMMSVENGDLKNAALMPASGVRRFEFNFSDNCPETGIPEKCGTDCYVEVVQTLLDASDPVHPVYQYQSAVYCLSCVCPGQPTQWMQTGQPYELYFGHQEVRMMVRLSDLGPPQTNSSFSAYGALYDSASAFPGAVSTPIDTIPRNLCDDLIDYGMQVTPDVNCPSVIMVEGINTASGVLSAPIDIVFDEPVALPAANAVSITPSPGVVVQTTLDDNDKRLHLQPAGNFLPGRYTITLSPLSLSPIQDLAGNPLDGDRDGVCGGPYSFDFCISDPNFYATDSAGVKKEAFANQETIYVRSEGFPSGQTGRLYLVSNHPLEPGMILADQTVDGWNVFTASGAGQIGFPVPINIGSALNPEEYKIVADFGGNGVYDVVDRVFGLCTAGLTVGEPCDSSLPDMAAYWRLDETGLKGTNLGTSAEAIDAHHGQWRGTPIPVPGMVHGALNFDDADHVEVDHHVDLNPADEFSIDAWVFIEAGTFSGTIIRKSGAAPGYDFRVHGGGGGGGSYELALTIDDGQQVFLISDGLPVPSNQWAHVAVTATLSDGRTLTGAVQFFINGQGGPVLSFPFTAGSLDNTEPVLIGSSFDGSIDELVFYNRDLDEEEILFLYAAGADGRCSDPVCSPVDLDCNGNVNVDDLLSVINHWGSCPTPCPPNCLADVNDNCAVNIDDLLMVINAWGPAL